MNSEPENFESVGCGFGNKRSADLKISALHALDPKWTILFVVQGCCVLMNFYVKTIYAVVKLNGLYM